MRGKMSQLEAAAFLAAMLVVLATEAACVYWLPMLNLARGEAANLSPITARWTEPTLPQCWMLGAVGMLIYRLVLLSARSASAIEVSKNRRAFLRLWCWTAAVGGAQILAVCLDRFTHGSL